MSAGGKRGLVVATVVAFVGLLLSMVTATASAASASTSRSASVDDGVRCSSDVATSPAVPVLLVPGTGMTAQENWGSSYAPALARLGHAVCTVDLPGQATGDVQVSAASVAAAIRDVHALAGRPIAVIGHSQGAFLPRVAVRVWPDLAPMLDDVIGLAGVYDHGSRAIADRCTDGCAPALQQLKAGAHLLHALARRPLPVGPSYTDIGTLGDTTITPQPVANTERGAHAVEIQDVCPGRTIALSEHALIVGDTVAFALATDALDHAGPASAARVPTSTCDQQYYDGFDPDPFLAAGPAVQERTAHHVGTEPAVRCFLRPTCRDADARGRMVGRSAAAVDHDVVTWRARIVRPGRVRLALPGRTVTRTVDVGVVTLRVPLDDGARAPRTLSVLTRPQYFTAYASEGHDRVA